MSIAYHILSGAKSTLPAGLKQHESCLKCSYGGQDKMVNYCKRPENQRCYKLEKK